MDKEVLQAIGVTAELTGTQLTEGAVRVMAADLSPYPKKQVLGALTRCRKELKGRFTVGDIVSRLEDGRPGPEEAWAMVPRDEATTVVWTDEMSNAFGVALPLIEEGDMIAARMAFIESYRRLVQHARDCGKQTRWTPSLGHDPSGREAVLLEAERNGLLGSAQVQALLPHMEQPAPEVAALLTAK